jgi:hypothetical protein
VNTSALTVSFLLAAGASQAAIPTSGLVANYEFTGDATDAGPHGLHGAVNGATLVADRFGRPNRAYAFDGHSYIEIADHDAFSVPTTGDFSMSVWMRPDVLTFADQEGTGYVHWMGKGEPSQHEWVWRMYGQNNTEGRVNRTSSYLFNLAGDLGAGVYVQETVTPGVWLHYVITISTSNDIELFYKNGVFKHQAPFQDSVYNVHPQNGTAPVRIGTRNFASYFEGAIDDVRFYNRVLTPTEIQQLYAEVPPTPTPTATATQRPRPTATSTMRPTATSTARPSPTATARPRATATSTARPRPTVSTTAWYRLVNRNSGKCVDARGSGTANGTIVQQYTCNTSYAQQFQLRLATGGYYRVANRNNAAQVLHVTNGSTADGARIVLRTYASLPQHEWQAVPEPATGSWRLVARHSGKCLVVPGAQTANSVQLQQATCTGGAAQSFLLQPR